MLSHLTIKNFGLIDEVSLDFSKNLNILTGETGAGKSILIDALRIVLGDRLNSSQLRDEKNPCIIEGIFQITDKDLIKLEIFDDFLSKDSQELIIQRMCYPDGRNKIKINGLNVTVGQLKTIGDHLVDFHGPNDHQMLLSSDSHLGMLDRLIKFENLFTQYDETFNLYNNLQNKLNDLQNMKQSKEREADLLSHQIKELEQVPLDETKYEEILQEQIKANNAVKLSECTSELLRFLDGDSTGASDNIRQAFSPMRTLNQYDEKTENLMQSLNKLQENTEEIISEIRSYADGLSFEPDEANEINSKCDIYDDIKRKYGPSLKEAKDFYEKAKEKFALLSNLENNDLELRKEIDKLNKKLSKIALDISKKRQDASTSLKKTIEKELTELGIANVKFESRVEKVDFNPKGQDKVTFYISPNAGVELKPLADIVSSGEAARVMLALKKALIKVDPIPVLIFDEIDAQIGGRLGTIIGEKLREISKVRQVILITHLPQIASFADSHFKVIKKVKDGKAVTLVESLNDASRVEELAKMLSGEKKSEIAIKHAKDMLANAKT